MKIMYSIITHCFFFLFIVLNLFSCKKTTFPTDEDQSDSRGIFGSVALYSEYGTLLSDASDVQIVAHCVDTLMKDSSGNATDIFDTILTIYTNEEGLWSFENCPAGYYSITALKDGFGEYSRYNHWYDTVRSDTLSTFTLAKSPLAHVIFDSIRYAQNLLYVSRTISFLYNYSEDYPVATWYFFDTTPQVSVLNHMYAYLSGASFGNLNKPHTYTMQMAIYKLRSHGFSEKDSVYVRIGLDNYKFSSYQNSNNQWIYPNVVEESSVIGFYLDSFGDD
ncbi:MAG: carboxypeptidase regulatory-like domain-containing protein [Bacteroidales bacterium]|nr:carboxypeptidase regulatory-like domain-containing protein [Bacteroidales bacterium]